MGLRRLRRPSLKNPRLWSGLPSEKLFDSVSLMPGFFASRWMDLTPAAENRQPLFGGPSLGIASLFPGLAERRRKERNSVRGPRLRPFAVRGKLRQELSGALVGARRPGFFL